jgi:hypothetical protein
MPASTGPSQRLPWPIDGWARTAWDGLSFYGRRLSLRLPVSVVQRMAATIECAQRPLSPVSWAATDDGATLSYTGSDIALRSALFGTFGACEEETIGAIRRTQVDPGYRTDAGATLVEVPFQSARDFGRRGWLILPRWIELEVDLRRPERELWSTRKRGAVRAVERSDLQAEVVEGEEALHEFYERMYVPTALARHGTHAFLRRPGYVRRAAARGVLVFARRGARRLAGLLLAPRFDGNRVIDAWLFGVRDGVYEGTTLAREAVYLYALRQARDVFGAERLGLTAAPPLLRYGLLRYKQGWGASASPGLRSPMAVAVRLSSMTPSIAARLTEKPLVALGFRSGTASLYVPVPVPVAASHRRAHTAIPPVEVRYRDVSELPALFERIATESAG